MRPCRHNVIILRNEAYEPGGGASPKMRLVKINPSASTIVFPSTSVVHFLDLSFHDELRQRQQRPRGFPRGAAPCSPERSIAGLAPGLFQPENAG